MRGGMSQATDVFGGHRCGTDSREGKHQNDYGQHGNFGSDDWQRAHTTRRNRLFKADTRDTYAEEQTQV